MGRELKRVSLKFQWEIGKLWSGYVNPYKRHECIECKGLGWSKDYEALKDEWYGYNNQVYIPNPFKKDARYNCKSWNHNLTQDDVEALIKANRLWDFTRVPINDKQREDVKKKIADGENSWLPYDNGYIPTAKEVNEWSLKGMGHDSMNCSIVIKAKLKKEGKSHLCKSCNGTGTNWQHPKAKSLYNNWKPYNPPKGDGFQLWSTTSEGHPMTPVFKTLEDLCEYCVSENVSIFGSDSATKEEWLNMLGEDIVVYKTPEDLIFI